MQRIPIQFWRAGLAMLRALWWPFFGTSSIATVRSAHWVWSDIPPYFSEMLPLFATMFGLCFELRLHLLHHWDFS